MKVSSTLFRLCLILSAFLVFSAADAQEKCATVEVRKLKRNALLIRETDDQFEKWVERKQANRIDSRINDAGVYTIPVVVHIIHKGEAIGSGLNISDAQIFSQIKALNRDFNRTNVDSTSTPDEFRELAGRMSIHFVLASQDPDGNATSGIIRVNGSKSQWTINDENTLKALSYWPAENYLNVWVADLSSTLLGYAQFPVSDVPGLESAVDNRLTDGVVIDYSVFGNSEEGSFELTTRFNKGRTTTHEVGHFLGLRHIWGDDSGSCSGRGDYVADTPNQGDNTSGCPAHPLTSCSVHTMFQNYMDYTNDVCMNLFTIGQVDRMTTVLEHSPRRLSLLSSAGSDDPAPVPNDLGIAALRSPTNSECTGTVVTSLTVVNKGNNNIASASFKISIRGIATTQDVSFAPVIGPGDSAAVGLSSVTLEAGENLVAFEILETNGLADAKVNDNSVSISAYSPYSIALPWKEEMNSFPSLWNQPVNDKAVAWEQEVAPKGSSANGALSLKFFNSSITAESNVLFTPTFNLPADDSPYAFFDVAYAQSTTADDDGLLIYLIDDCATAAVSGSIVYQKKGVSLSTTERTSSQFTPSSENDWRHEVIDLSPYRGHDNLRLAFVGINDGGNNIYIDNVAVASNVTEDAAITRVNQPSPVICASSVIPVIDIYNPGNTTLSSLKVTYSLNGGPLENRIFSNLELLPSNRTTITMTNVQLNDGENKFVFQLSEPNGLFDRDTTNNTLTYYAVVDAQTDIIPLRQNFDEDISTWVIANPNGESGLQRVNTNYDQSLNYADDPSGVEREAWFVSPSLDLSNTSKASMFFDLAAHQTDAVTAGYDAQAEAAKDSIKVLISTDCGETYSAKVFEASVSSFVSSGTSPTPSSIASWHRNFIDLSTYAGQQNVRIAFVFRKSVSKSVFLDNIEMFLSDDPAPLSTEQAPFIVYGTDPASPQDFYITFNLSERQPVKYRIVDVTGKAIISQEWDDVLNQTYHLEPSVSGGMYVLQLYIGQEHYATKIFLH